MIKMVFSDLDGTFLTPEKTISDKNSRMLGALHERGILAALQSHEFEPGARMLALPWRMPSANANGRRTMCALAMPNRVLVGIF
nr:HAD hydrolase family protein [Collinsella provencensis]